MHTDPMALVGEWQDGTTRLLLAQDGRVYDDLGNPMPRDALKGRVPNGECGLTLCAGRPASRWHSGFKLFVCEACADERNRLARALNRDAAGPCGAPPAEALQAFVRRPAVSFLLYLDEVDTGVVHPLHALKFRDPDRYQALIDAGYSHTAALQKIGCWV